MCKQPRTTIGIPEPEQVTIITTEYGRDPGRRANFNYLDLLNFTVLREQKKFNFDAYTFRPPYLSFLAPSLHATRCRGSVRNLNMPFIVEVLGGDFQPLERFLTHYS